MSNNQESYKQGGKNLFLFERENSFPPLGSPTKGGVKI